MDDGLNAVTIKDIAKKAEVSIGTVDRVIHNRGRVAEKTYHKIKKIITELGYKPNIFASRLSQAKVYNFGVLMPHNTQDSGYWQGTIEGIKKAAAELAAYHVRVPFFFYDRYQPEQFQEKCAEIMAARLDGLLTVPLLKTPLKKFVQSLPQNFPYVFFNTSLQELSPLSFIGQDPFQSGLVCGKLMKLIVHTPGTVAVIITHRQDEQIRQRATGFCSLFKDQPTFTIREYHFNPEEQSRARIRTIFQENPDLRGIFVTNVSTHYLAAYLAQSPPVRKVFLIGYDLIAENVNFLQSGQIDFLINQKPAQQGYEGILMLYRHVILRENCRESLVMPIDIVTKENVRYYLDN